MNTRIRDLIFFFLCFFMIFNNIPKVFRVQFLGGPLIQELIIYPVILVFLYTFYCKWKGAHILINTKKTFIYFGTFTVFLIISIVWGFIQYPYYDLLLNGPTNPIEKLPALVNFGAKFGISLPVDMLTVIWLIVRSIKGIILDIAYTFGVSYLIYCWYHNDLKNAINVFSRGLLCSLAVFLIYGIIDIFFQKNFEFAKVILQTINPHLYTVKEAYNWWPPLFWVGQVRSIFSEPSIVGNYMAVVLPFIWICLIKIKKISFPFIIYFLLSMLSAIMIFMTQARAANAMLLGIFTIFMVAILLGKGAKYIKNILAILASICLAFAITLGLFNFGEFRSADFSMDSLESMSTSDFIDSNIASLVSSNKRSNGARYGIIKTHIKIGLDHPLVGVGPYMVSAYVPDYVDEPTENNVEIKSWLKGQKDKGVASGNGLLALNEYVNRFSMTGIIGLALYLLPFIYAICILAKQLWKSDKDKLLNVWILTFLISTLAAGMNISNVLIYGPWLALAFAYIVISGRLGKNS